MQDKNIDELFRSKLESFEIEPSAGVWPRITVEIGVIRRKRAWFLYLSAAASIIILLAAGIFFIPKKGRKDGKQPAMPYVVKAAASQPVVKSESILPSTVAAIARANKKRHGVVVESIRPVTKNPDTGKTEGPAIASLSPRAQQDGDTGVPGTATQLEVKQSVAVSAGFITHPTITQVRLPVISDQNNEPVKTGHKIRSLGGLINAVVARVDKRRDKIIEFTDDDDETNVTGINLGIIKIKKEK